MKKFICLFLAICSFNTTAMEVGEEESAAQDVCHIDLIPDKLIRRIIDVGIRDCLIIDDEGKLNFFELNNLANSINKILDFCGTIERVCKRFKKCQDFIIQRCGIAELDGELADMGESASGLNPGHLEVFTFLSSTMKIKAIDFLIKRYNEAINYCRLLNGLSIEPLVFSSKPDVNAKLKCLLKNKDSHFLSDEKLIIFFNKVILLLGGGADVNLPIKYKNYGATRKDSLLCLNKNSVRFKSPCGCSIERNKDWKNLIRFLLFRASYLFREIDLYFPLFAAIEMNDYDLASLLIKRVDPNICDKKGKTLLMLIISSSPLSFKELLDSGILNIILEQGIDVNSSDEDGQNALYEILHCYKHKSVKLINLLCDYRLRLHDTITIKTNKGLVAGSALAWSVYFARKKEVRLLLNKGVNINGKYINGKSIIEYAREKISSEMNARRHDIFQMIVDKEKENSDVGGLHFCTIS